MRAPTADSEISPALMARGFCFLRSLLDILAWGGIALLPLACRPDSESAFFTPKLHILLVTAVAAGAAAWFRRGEFSGMPAWPALIWAAAVSISATQSTQGSLTALLVAIGAVPLFWAGAGGRFRTAVAASSIVEAIIALLQYAGADPLALLGWHAEAFASPRMRVYGTLGNPDFVAAWCCATLPVSYVVFVRRSRGRWAGRLGWGLLAVQAAGIAATGSRAVLLAFSAQAAVLVFRGGRKRWLALLPVAAALILLPGSRPLDETVRGRLYLARVALTRPAQVPLFGNGPGSFELQFAARQSEWLRTHPDDIRFAGPVDHAHNDYAEFFVEYGPLGLCAMIAALIGAAVKTRRLRLGAETSIGAAAAAAGLAGLLALALVDFPLHRPAEWALFWLFLGELCHSCSGPAINSSSSTRSGR